MESGGFHSTSLSWTALAVKLQSDPSLGSLVRQVTPA
jgi:hypothetical protein